MQSNVGNAQIHEAGEQRTSKAEDGPPRFTVTHDNAHSELDPKDQRTAKNRLAAVTSGAGQDEKSKTVEDPLKPAQDQGHEPSRGAKIDAELKAEDEAIMREKGRV